MRPPHRSTLALALALTWAPAWAQQEPAGAGLQPSTGLKGLPRGDAARQQPAVVQAQRIESRPDIGTVADGDVEFRRGGLTVRADHVTYDNADDLAVATGHVRVTRDGAVYKGTQLQLRVQRFEGFFLQPEFELPWLGAGGRADRIDFIDSARSRATHAEYTSCPRDVPSAEPAWLLRANSVSLDLDANEGVAEGGVLRFQGVPILAAPRLSFPLSDARKSGWLPPSFYTDSRSGLELAVPWYWNIAPNRDATFTPRVITRRGLGLDSEFRYLEPRLKGSLQFDWLPDDRVAHRSRDSVLWLHEGSAFDDARYSVNLRRVSDDDWWRDFPNARRALTPRLLPTHASLEQPFTLRGGGSGLAYVRLTQWQVLQGSDQIVVSPYERTPQVGVRLGARRGGWQWGMESEFNRFTLPGGEQARAGRVGGDRVHLLANTSYAWREPGWWIEPKLSVNAASYADVPGAQSGDPSSRASRVIPTLSVDLGMTFERDTRAFGRALLQTLEPRLLYVNTPYHAQSQLPNYDAAGKDFNFASIYSDNQFSGVDRVSDAHQLTAGAISRFIDSTSGVEALRLGLVQRYLFRTQRVTAQADGTPDGAPLEQRLSDVLLLGSTSVLPSWTLDATLQYSPENRRSIRSVIGARYSPGPFRTVSATYRLARGLSEQMELGWQWPVFGGPRDPGAARNASSGSGGCSGNWYSVGRVNYSMKDSRITDSVIGAEYDAGCWIGRFVAERLSTGRSQATTRFMVQLELVGLSRIGSNPLQVLKDNIPGYRLLRDDRSSTTDRPNAPLYD